jgi:hypothetical protein
MTTLRIYQQGAAEAGPYIKATTGNETPAAHCLERVVLLRLGVGRGRLGKDSVKFRIITQ